jgi:hypothetical protein
VARAAPFFVRARHFESVDTEMPMRDRRGKSAECGADRPRLCPRRAMASAKIPQNSAILSGLRPRRAKYLYTLYWVVHRNIFELATSVPSTQSSLATWAFQIRGQHHAR